MIMVFRKKRILILSAGLLSLLIATLIFTGCNTPQNKPTTAGSESGFVNSPESPVSITSIKVEEAPLYYEVLVNYTNNTAKIINQIEFDVLLFDENGNPLVDTHAQSSCKHITCKKQLVPNGSGSGKWLVQLGTQKVKARIANATYLDGTVWEDPEMNSWLEAEIAKF